MFQSKSNARMISVTAEFRRATAAIRQLFLEYNGKTSTKRRYPGWFIRKTT